MSDRLIRMIKERAFVVEDIRAGSIWEIEKMITDTCSTKIKEYDLWTETDGLQGVNCQRLEVAGTRCERL